MSFSISLLSEVMRNPESNEVSALGILRLGDFQESFTASLSYWTAKQYRRQWLEAVERLVLKMETKSSLVTSMFDPDIANFIMWCPMYRFGGVVHIQNQILFLEELEELSMRFTESKLFSFVPERQTHGEDGKLSEWTVSIEDLESFLFANRLLRAA